MILSLALGGDPYPFHRIFRRVTVPAAAGRRGPRWATTTWDAVRWGRRAKTIVIYGDIYGILWDVMGFDADFMGFDADFMGFYGILWDLMLISASSQFLNGLVHPVHPS